MYVLGIQIVVYSGPRAFGHCLGVEVAIAIPPAVSYVWEICKLATVGNWS